MIGGGAQGKVHRAIDKNSGSTLAVKIIQTFGYNLKAIEKEIKVMKSLTHKNYWHMSGIKENLFSHGIL